jgi:putative RNA 2'-phosphotransferase
MNDKEKTHLGKFLSLLLRHQPDIIGLTLDVNGWADVEELIRKCSLHGQPFTKEELEEIVATNDKKRYAFNDDHTRIRANQGHSLEVELHLKIAEPPGILYHGTVDKFLESIGQEGLVKKSRQHVHLSQDLETAQKVGSRRGVPVVLKINAGDMHRNGHVFYISDNDVWLTDHVPPTFLVK